MSTDLSMIPPMMAVITSMLDANARVFEKATAGIPDAEWLAMPGDQSNHLAWIAGHIVVHRAKIPKLVGQEWSSPWEGLFARGAKLVAAGNYPKPDELRQAWKDVSEKLTVGLSGVSAEVLAKPAPEGMPSFNGKISGTLSVLCFHETYHIGQLGYLRKLLGYGQAVG